MINKLITSLFVSIAVTGFSQELSPKEVTNLHIKAIVNADNESIDKLGKYFAQIAVEPNENVFEGFKTMYDEIGASTFSNMIENKEINKKFEKDTVLKNAVTQAYNKLYARLRKVDCQAQSVKTAPNQYIENSNIATVTYKCSCEVPDYSKFKDSFTAKLTKPEILSRLKKFENVLMNTTKKVGFTREYRLYESHKDGKTFWENGSMTELITDVFGELLSTWKK